MVVDLLAGGGDDLVLAAACTGRVTAATEGVLVGLAANLKLV